MPKKKSTGLFDLVHSLNKTESGYFKKFSGRHGSGPGMDYIKLFDILSSQKAADEENALKKGKFRNYSRLKNYLYHSILLSMQSYHSHDSSTAQLRKYLSDIEVLYGKALYSHCKKTLKKARKLAIAYEKFNIYIELVNWEIRILQANIELGVLQKNSERFLSEIRASFDKIQNITGYTLLYSRIYTLIRQRGPARDSGLKKVYDHIITHPLMRSEHRARSAFAKMLYYHIHAVYMFACHEYEKENSYSGKLIQHIEAEPALYCEEKERYLIALNNYTDSCIRLGRFEQGQALIKKLQLLSAEISKMPDVNNLQYRIFARSMILQMLLYNKSGNSAKALEFLSINELQLKKNRHGINLANLGELYFCIAYSYFLTRDNKKSLRWLNKVTTDRSFAAIHDFYFYCHLLSIAVHIELSNYKYADYLVRIVRDLLNQNGEENKFELIVLKCFSSLIRVGGKTGDIPKAHYRKQLEELRSRQNTSFENSVLNYFDVISWIKTKAE